MTRNSKQGNTNKQQDSAERVRLSETVQSDGGEEIEIYCNDVLYLLDEYMDKWKVDLHNEPLSRWSAAMLYIGKYFKGTNKLKQKPHDLTPQERERRGGTITRVSNNAYDLDKVKQLCDLYIGLCYEYGKEISIMGFSKMTGIDLETFYSWQREGPKASQQGAEIVKILTSEREESLSERLFSNKGNPVGILGILNHWYNWNMGQPRGNTAQAPASIETIQAKYLNNPAPENIPPLPDNSPPAENIPPSAENSPLFENNPLYKENTPPESYSAAGMYSDHDNESNGDQEEKQPPAK